MKDYCPVDVVTPTWRPAYSILRPEGLMACRGLRSGDPHEARLLVVLQGVSSDLQ